MNIELRDYFAAQAMNAQIISVEGIEHTNSKQCAALASCAYAMADAMLAAREAGKPEKKADDSWTEWYGGECPVDADTVVEAKLREADYVIKDKAGFLIWERRGKISDIIAYRVVQS